MNQRDQNSVVSGAAAALGKLGGKSTSPAKQAASRKNGRKGGRPAKGAVGKNTATARARESGQPVRFDYDNNQIMTVLPDGTWWTTRK